MAARRAAVLVSVVAANGSVPRRAGTRMIVTADAIAGTIGGGHLELKAIDIARDCSPRGGSRALHAFRSGRVSASAAAGAAQLLFEPVLGDPPWLETLARLRAGERSRARSSRRCAATPLADGSS